MPCCSNGRPRPLAQRPTTAGRHGSSCDGGIRSRTTTAACSPSTRSRAELPGLWPAVHGHRGRWQRRRPAQHGAEPGHRVREDLSASTRWATTARTRNTEFPPTIRCETQPGALPEIYAYGVRNPQRFAWDSRNGAMVHVRHRSEHCRGDQPRHAGRQSRVERVGGQLQVRGARGRGARKPARRPDGDLSDRRMGTGRPASATPVGRWRSDVLIAPSKSRSWRTC